MNTPKRFLALLLSVIGLLAGCSKVLSGNGMSKPSPLLFDSIRLERGACFGRCPVYSVEVNAEGRVLFDGRDFVKRKGITESRIARADLELLSAALMHTHFQELRDSYSEQEDGCGNLVTDMASFSIHVSMKGSQKRVYYYEGCSGPNIPSANLRWLADTIDHLAGADRITD